MKMALLLGVLLWPMLTPTHGYDPRVQPGCPMNDLPPSLIRRTCGPVLKMLAEGAQETR